MGERGELGGGENLGWQSEDEAAGCGFETRGNGWEDAREGTEPLGARELLCGEGQLRLEEAGPQSPLPGQVPTGSWLLLALASCL